MSNYLIIFPPTLRYVTSLLLFFLPGKFNLTISLFVVILFSGTLLSSFTLGIGFGIVLFLSKLLTFS
jgi:hypothetical protein